MTVVIMINAEDGVTACSLVIRYQYLGGTEINKESK
jgi:hypothetical protein